MWPGLLVSLDDISKVMIGIYLFEGIKLKLSTEVRVRALPSLGLQV